MKIVRPPQAAIWNFYPIDRQKLLAEIERCFRDSVLGPGGLPQCCRSEKVVAGVVPHSIYRLSGPCAAWFYKEVGDTIESIDTVVIVGAKHVPYGTNAVTTKRFVWSTPLGYVDVDEELIDEISSIYPLDDDALALSREHSIEVQLPFLQYLFKDFKLVPIALGDLSISDIRSLARAIKRAIDRLKRRALVIASSDFTHHGEEYGYTLFRTNIRSSVAKLDLSYIEKIVSLDTEGFLSLLRKYRGNVCGDTAIAVVMEYAKLLNARGRLLKYYNSADVTRDEKSVVGFASIAFYTHP